ncbi:MAG: DsbA family protein [Hoeflea sp.]|uniref:DsbA family protein n=1 Tax=Hoeflea sp. TaxID=1940281 RepID=UPI0032EF570E
MQHNTRNGLFSLIVVGVAAGVAGGFAAVAGGSLFGIASGSRITAPVIEQAAEPAGVDQESMGALVRDYILENPEVLEEAQQILQARREEESRQLAMASIETNRDAIFNAPDDMVIGNPEGDITLVEFFDYNCGYCKRAMDDVVEIIKADPNVRVVLKEFPILGPDSLAAHQVSMAFRNLAPDRYGDFHMALLGADVRASEAVAIELAKQYGVDEEALRENMNDPAIEESIRRSYQLADTLGISGTPSFVLGDETVFGAVGSETLLAKIANVRQCESTVC